MKLKPLIIGVMLIMLGGTLIATANIDPNNYRIDTMHNPENNEFNNSFYGDLEVIIIRVAVLFEEPSGNMIGTNKEKFSSILDYGWIAGNKNYFFLTTPIYDKDILRGTLIKDNYDVLICPGGDVGAGEAMIRGFFRRPINKLWKNNIAKFVKNGGGYVSYCGGTVLFTELSKTPETFSERQYDKSSLGLSCVKSYYNCGSPLYPIVFPNKAEKIGAFMYLKSGSSFLDMPINTDHPIFDDFLNDTRLIMWGGGPALVLPDNPDRAVDALALYPEKEIHEIKPLYAWKYTGGIRGLIKAFFEQIKARSNKNILLETLCTAKDWEKTDKIIDLNYSNKPCMTAEVYPNGNKARIVLNGPHPDYPVWQDPIYEEAEDTDDNDFNGLYHTIQKTNGSFSNWWIVRREVAWAAKVPDNDLPPVYGSSQVCDIYPYEQPLNFTITGVCDDKHLMFNGKASLDLFYSYSHKNSDWTPWTLYETDINYQDGWSWEFDSPNGLGYYQFYSLSHVEYEYDVIDETAPPGPDAIAKVIE